MIRKLQRFKHTHIFAKIEIITKENNNRININFLSLKHRFSFTNDQKAALFYKLFISLQTLRITWLATNQEACIFL